MTRRGRLQVIKDGLRGVAETGRKTSFLSLAEISYKMHVKYFQLSIEKQLIKQDGNRFEVTDKGWKFIESVETAEQLIGE